MSGSVRWGAAVIIAVIAMTVSGSAMAFPGVNGKIVFVKGQAGEANDNGADVYIMSGPNGAVVDLDTRAGQHRHPAWSPDLRRVAYALQLAPFQPPTGQKKIWVHNVATGVFQRLGPNNAAHDDRPAWSPSGNKIAWESDVDGSLGDKDILIKDIRNGVSGGGVVNLTKTPGADEGKPAFSIDGQWIYYSWESPSGDNDILRIRSNGQGSPQSVLVTSTNEIQPALSPDGKHMCYTRGPFGSVDADVYVVELGSFTIGEDVSDTALGAYNCVFSPDGVFVAYVRGTFSNGALMYERADDNGTPQALAPDTAMHFDGNPDWAPQSPAFCKGKPLTMAGTGGPDTIEGTMGRDVIAAFGGNDVVGAQAGNDRVCGGKGGDRIKGGAGNDVLYGDPGDDRLRGGSGRDTCIGGNGADVTSECE